MNDSVALSSKDETIRNVPEGLFWRGHSATPTQRRMLCSRRAGRVTQADLLIDMLRRARAAGRALELPEIQDARIAQHGARFREIRERGFVVINQLERAEDGRVLSRYFLRHDPERDNG